MISWIQQHLIRHGRWIFLLLLAVVIVAFVFTIGNVPGFGPATGGAQKREFYGYDLNSRQDMQALSDMFTLSRIFRNGQPPRNQQRARQGTLERIALLHLADRIGIPEPSSSTLSDYIHGLRPFQTPQGEFSQDRYTRMMDRLKTNPRFSDDRIVRVLKDDYRLQQLRETLQGPGYILPSEAVEQARRSQTEYALSTATLDYAAFDPEIRPDEAKLRQYYERNAETFRVPELVQASYVFFPSQAFMDDAAEPSESELRSHFVDNRERFVQARQDEESTGAEGDGASDSAAGDGNGSSARDDKQVTFEDVKAAVRQDYLEKRAERLANEAAEALAFSFYEEEIDLGGERFDKKLAASQAKRVDLPPYDPEAPEGSDLPADFLGAAKRLDGKRYYSDPHELEDGFGILIREGREPSRVPPFEEIRDEVRQAYSESEKRRLFNEKGQELKTSLESALEEGKGFSDAASALGLETRRYEPFTRRNRPRDLPGNLLSEAENLEEGAVSPMISDESAGRFVYLRSKNVPEINPDDPSVQRNRQFLTRFHGMLRVRGVVDAMIQKEMPEGATPRAP